MVTLNDILLEYNIVGMSIAVAIGIAGQEFIFSLNNDIVMPSIARIFPYDFFKEYKFDLYKFISKTITFIFVFGIIMILFFTILNSLVKTKMIKEKEMSRMNSKRLQILEEIQQKLTSDVAVPLNKVHNSVNHQTNLIKTLNNY